MLDFPTQKEKLSSIDKRTQDYFLKEIKSLKNEIIVKFNSISSDLQEVKHNLKKKLELLERKINCNISDLPKEKKEEKGINNPIVGISFDNVNMTYEPQITLSDKNADNSYCKLSTISNRRRKQGNRMNSTYQYDKTKAQPVIVNTKFERYKFLYEKTNNIYNSSSISFINNLPNLYIKNFKKNKDIENIKFSFRKTNSAFPSFQLDKVGDEKNVFKKGNKNEDNANKKEDNNTYNKVLVNEKKIKYKSNKNNNSVMSQKKIFFKDGRYSTKINKLKKKNKKNDVQNIFYKNLSNSKIKIKNLLQNK